MQIQKEINDYQNFKVNSLDERLSLCGKFVVREFGCNACNGAIVKRTCALFSCEIRYCDNPDCLVSRFKNQFNVFDSIPEFKPYKKLWHFVIGFEPIPELEFKKNFSKHYKRFSYVLNKYFEKLRKEGVKIRAVRVLDFSFTKEGFVYMHFHFGALPVSQSHYRSTLLKIQSVRKKMITKMKIKTPFHYQSFQMASKHSIFSYFAIRSSGMYKYDITTNTKYKHVPKNLRESIVNFKYIFLKNVLTKEEYLKSFYNKPFYQTIGGVKKPLHSSNTTDTIPCSCSIHGFLSPSEYTVSTIFYTEMPSLVNPPPIIQKTEELIIEYVKI